MNEMIKWLRAQLDTDERLALAADPGPWEVGTSFGGGDTRVFIREAGSPGIDTVGSTCIPSVFASQVANKTQFRENASHIANNDPARVLRQVQAHRAILDLLSSWRHNSCQDGWYSCSQASEANGFDIDEACADENRAGQPCDCGLDVRQRKILAPLASIYSDRDGYKEEWTA